jgi:hypothetical protein
MRHRHADRLLIDRHLISLVHSTFKCDRVQAEAGMQHRLLLKRQASELVNHILVSVKCGEQFSHGSFLSSCVLTTVDRRPAVHSIVAL